MSGRIMALSVSKRNRVRLRANSGCRHRWGREPCCPCHKCPLPALPKINHPGISAVGFANCVAHIVLSLGNCYEMRNVFCLIISWLRHFKLLLFNVFGLCEVPKAICRSLSFPFYPLLYDPRGRVANPA